MSWPVASTTGSPLILFYSINCAALRIVSLAGTEITFRVITSLTCMVISAFLPQEPIDQPFIRFSAERLRNTICREVGRAIAAEHSNEVRVRDTVSIVKPR